LRGEGEEGMVRGVGVGVVAGCVDGGEELLV